MRFLVFAALAFLAACGPNIGALEKGEKGTVSRVVNGDTLELDNGLRVFLAEIDAPGRDAPYAQQAAQELEALALHRPVVLAYGGTHRWTPRRPGRANGRSDDADGAAATNTATTLATSAATSAVTTAANDDEPAGETAVAHVFVQSEGGRRIWLQQQMVAQGAAYVRPRRDNHARTAELLHTEAVARAAHRGLWALRDYAILTPRKAADAAAAANLGCRSGRFAFVEGTVQHANLEARRAVLEMEGAPFSIAVFGQGFSSWDGAPLGSLTGKRVRVRGSLGMFHDAAQLCIDNAGELEVLTGPAH